MFYIEEIRSKVRENEQKFIAQFEKENKEILEKVKTAIDQQVEKLERFVHLEFKNYPEIQSIRDNFIKYFNLIGFRTNAYTYSITVTWYENSFSIEDYIREIANECVIES